MTFRADMVDISFYLEEHSRRLLSRVSAAVRELMYETSGLYQLVFNSAGV